MKSIWRNRIVALLAMTVLGGVLSPAALANPWNRDAGAKMRGDYGTSTRSVARAPRRYQAAPRIDAPALVQAPTQRRSYSYEPAPRYCEPEARVQAQAQRPQRTEIRRYSYEPAGPAVSRPMTRAYRSQRPSYERAESKMLGRYGF
jgi:hypothetical protein